MCSLDAQISETELGKGSEVGWKS